MTIGVFDSGKGGAHVAARLSVLLPQYDYMVANDSAHVPYGTRSQEEILQLTDHAIQPLLAKCSVIVIACNTVTTAAIHSLRARYPGVHFVGLEPMIKPASMLTKSGHIVMLATPYTLASLRYRELRQAYACNLMVDEPATGHWPRMIENDEIEAIDISEVVTAYKSLADVIVLGCTHYLALIPRLQAAMPNAKILEPSEAIARRIQQILLSPQPAISIGLSD